MNSKLKNVSRKLSKLLRHDLTNFTHDLHGFVELDLILKSDTVFKGIKIDDIKIIVDQDEKSRFSLEFKNNKYFIRANQGHTTGKLNDSEMLTPLNEQIEGCFHATFSSNINSIKKNGLSRMERKHIHIAESDNAKSGKRKTSNVKIYINMKSAIEDGIKFYQSENKCILTPGNDDGILLPKYFLKIEEVNKN